MASTFQSKVKAKWIKKICLLSTRSSSYSGALVAQTGVRSNQSHF